MATSPTPKDLETAKPVMRGETTRGAVQKLGESDRIITHFRCREAYVTRLTDSTYD